VFQDGEFTASSIVAAMDESRRGGADIVSMSLGGASSSIIERNKVNQFAKVGIALVAVSGNSGADANPEEYPASYDNVISVGAINDNEEVANFSTHNSQVDITAPGVNILSLSNICYDCYSYNSGTSMAVPHGSAW